MLVEIDSTSGLVAFREPRAVADEPGYDNQPAFDGAGRLLFSSTRAGQNDVWAFDLATGDTVPLTRTLEGEFSPLPVPGGTGFLAVRVERDGRQRVWRFDAADAAPRPWLERPDYVGYHAWVDEQRAALLVLGDPPRLALADRGQGALREVARGIGRALQRIPGRAAVSYVDRSDAAPWIAELDLDRGTTRRLVPALDGAEDHAWTPDGTLLMARGARVFAWRESAPEWSELVDFSAAELGRISRIAVSADGRWLAFVVDEPA